MQAASLRRFTCTCAATLSKNLLQATTLSRRYVVRGEWNGMKLPGNHPNHGPPVRVRQIILRSCGRNVVSLRVGEETIVEQTSHKSSHSRRSTPNSRFDTAHELTCSCNTWRAHRKLTWYPSARVCSSRMAVVPTSLQGEGGASQIFP